MLTHDSQKQTKKRDSLPLWRWGEMGFVEILVIRRNDRLEVSTMRPSLGWCKAESWSNGSLWSHNNESLAASQDENPGLSLGPFFFFNSWMYGDFSTTLIGAVRIQVSVAIKKENNSVEQEEPSLSRVIQKYLYPFYSIHKCINLLLIQFLTHSYITCNAFYEKQKTVAGWAFCFKQRHEWTRQEKTDSVVWPRVCLLYSFRNTWTKCLIYLFSDLIESIIHCSHYGNSRLKIKEAFHHGWALQ